MTSAQQGHAYEHAGTKVIALESGRSIRVAVVEAGEPWFTATYNAKADWLRPLPMAYFHGQVPA